MNETTYQLIKETDQQGIVWFKVYKNGSLQQVFNDQTKAEQFYDNLLHNTGKIEVLREDVR